MEFIFYIATFNAFFFALLLFQKRSRAIHDKILIAWLTFLGLFIGTYSFYSHNLFTNFHLLSISLISLLHLHGAFLFIYTSRLISLKKRFNRKNLLHFVPFIVFNLYLYIVSFFPDIANEIRMEHVHTDVHPPFLFVFFLILTLLSGPFYFVLTLKLFKKHNINIFNNFSSTEMVNLEWLRKLVFIFGIAWTILIIITVTHHIFNYFSTVFCTDSLFLALSVFVILIGYFGLKQKVIFENEIQEEQKLITKEKAKYSGSTLKEEEANAYANKLNQFMLSEKPFLDPGLTLSQLASQINISSHYLSQIINEKFELNFFEYINQFRIKEVKARIKDPKFENFSLLAIAFDSGFNSKSAFNRIFKKFTKKTPSQYKESCCEK